MKRLIFHFDPVSPFAFLAFERLPEALEGCSYHVDYRPVLLAGLLEVWGQTGPAEIEPKREWTFRQVAWLARRLSIPLQVPGPHPFNSLPLQRLALASAAPGELPNRWVVETLMRHVWQAEGADPNDGRRLASLQHALQPLRDPQDPVVQDELRQELRRSTELAVARGVFGVPSIEHDGLQYWGLDALPMLREAITAD